MKAKRRPCVFFVDDEPGIRRIVTDELDRLGCDAICFAGATECLEQLSEQDCNLLITDMKMPGMDGLALLKKVKRIAPWVPVIIATGYGDIPAAIRALKLGAVDFVEKPLDKNFFLEKIKSTLEQDDLSDSDLGQALTKTEKKVLKLILQGMANKEIAFKLSRSVRMVELHRSHIMQKFGTDNVVGLVKKAALMDFIDVA